MNGCVVVSKRSAGALTERLSLLSEVGFDDFIFAEDAVDAVSELRRRGKNGLVYFLDLNVVTAPAAIWACADRRQTVVDIGDDAYGLARAAGRSMLAATFRRVIEALAIARAHVVYRGRLHPIFRNFGGESGWFPDTAPDWVLDADLPEGDPDVLGTFGSIYGAYQGGWVYGREVIDALLSNRSLRGVVVVRGPGVDMYRDQVHKAGVSGRMTVYDEMGMEELVGTMCAVRAITSYQGNNVGGWVRTTGKLPLALASGRALIANAVGEAALVLPRDWVYIGERSDAGRLTADRLSRLSGQAVCGEARYLAETYRRSTVALGLVKFCGGL